jgi:hypothetical protein
MHKFFVDFLGEQVYFETNSILLVKIMEKYGSLPFNNDSTFISSSKPISITLWQEKDRFIVKDNRKNKSFCFDDERKAVTFCGSLFLGICAERLQPEYCMFHGAAVSLGEKAYIFMGDSGLGKTTLALSLITEDFKLLCDDLSILELNSNLVLPLKIKIGIDKDSPFIESFNAKMFEQSWYGSKMHVYLKDIFDEDRWGKPAPLKSIFFLEKGDEGSPQIEPLPQYEGFRRLCGFYIYGKKDLNIIIGQNCKILDNATCYMLKRGDVHETVKLIRETVLEEIRC